MSVQLFEQACERLAATTKRTEKESILKEVLQNAEVKELFRRALDGYEMFYVTVAEGSGFSEMTYEGVTAALDKLSQRKITGNDAVELASVVFESKWLSRLLNKNLQVGVAAKTINKVCPGLVKEFELMLCEPLKFDEGESWLTLHCHLDGEWFCQRKYDGLRCVMIVTGGEVFAYSRSGKPLSNLDNILDEVRSVFGEQEVVLDGEILAGGGAGDFALTTSIARSDVSQLPAETIEKLRYHIFDFVPGNEWKTKKFITPFHKRHILLHAATPQAESFKYLRIAQTERADFTHELQPLKHVEDGFEGTILRNGSAVYELKRSRQTLKYKQFKDCELRIVGFEEGTGKNAGALGALLLAGVLGEKGPHFEGEGTALHSKVGSGFSNAVRADFWTRRDSLLNQIVTVKYQNVCKAEGSEDFSLRFPVFRRLHPGV